MSPPVATATLHQIVGYKSSAARDKPRLRCRVRCGLIALDSAFHSEMTVSNCGWAFYCALYRTTAVASDVPFAPTFEVAQGGEALR